MDRLTSACQRRHPGSSVTVAAAEPGKNGNMEDQIQLKLTKRFEHDDDASRVRPAYTNTIDLARVGSEVFMDVCIIPMDDLAKAKENQATGTEAAVEVIVLDRYVFGLDTFLRLHSAVSTIHADLSKIGALPHDATFRINPR